MYPQRFLDGTPVPADYQNAVSRLISGALAAEELITAEAGNDQGAAYLMDEFERKVDAQRQKQE